MCASILILKLKPTFMFSVSFTLDLSNYGLEIETTVETGLHDKSKHYSNWPHRAATRGQDLR